MCFFFLYVQIFLNNIITGGFSIVYLVKDSNNSEKQYALKKMYASTKEQINDCENEIKLMKSFKHVNLLPLIYYEQKQIEYGKFEFNLLLEYCSSLYFFNFLYTCNILFFSFIFLFIYIYILFFCLATLVSEMNSSFSSSERMSEVQILYIFEGSFITICYYLHI